MKGVPFHQDNAPADKSVAAVADVCDCGFELVDHPPYSLDLAPSDYIFSVPQHEKTHLAGKQYVGSRMKSYQELRSFSRIKMRASIQREAKQCNADGRSVWTAKDTMLKNKPHLVRFNHCSIQIVSIQTFLPNLAASRLEIAWFAA